MWTGNWTRRMTGQALIKTRHEADHMHSNYLTSTAADSPSHWYRAQSFRDWRLSLEP